MVGSPFDGQGENNLNWYFVGNDKNFEKIKRKKNNYWEWGATTRNPALW
jgi:hypothetical protein